METILLVVHLIIAILLVITVLMQRSEGGGLGIGGGGGANVGGLMSVRGTANFLTRATAVLAGCFMLTSLTLAIIAGNRTTPQSILDSPAATSTPQPESKEGDVPLSR
ncbi:MAG: preprotein translocase subunit SecG [Alphaproteobacteria bacterium]|nr:preprotein translocase subunit SecG [Alphaproteobacteria bacterium]